MNFLRTVRVFRKPGDVSKGIMCAGMRKIACSLGRSGPTVHKREGDGATPAYRIMRPISGFFRADRAHRPHSPLLFDAIGHDDGWCDDPTDANYNLPVKLPYARSHERMMREDELYNIGVVLDWNMPPQDRSRHRGSAIFLHLCRPGYQPTEGCVAVKERDMRWLLMRIDRKTRFVVMR